MNFTQALSRLNFESIKSQPQLRLSIGPPEVYHIKKLLDKEYWTTLEQRLLTKKVIEGLVTLQKQQLKSALSLYRRQNNNENSQTSQDNEDPVLIPFLNLSSNEMTSAEQQVLADNLFCLPGQKRNPNKYLFLDRLKVENLFWVNEVDDELPYKSGLDQHYWTMV